MLRTQAPTYKVIPNQGQGDCLYRATAISLASIWSHIQFLLNQTDHPDSLELNQFKQYVAKNLKVSVDNLFAEINLLFQNQEFYKLENALAQPLRELSISLLRKYHTLYFTHSFKLLIISYDDFIAGKVDPNHGYFDDTFKFYEQTFNQINDAANSYTNMDNKQLANALISLNIFTETEINNNYEDLLLLLIKKINQENTRENFAFDYINILNKPNADELTAFKRKILTYVLLQEHWQKVGYQKFCDVSSQPGEWSNPYVLTPLAKVFAFSYQINCHYKDAMQHARQYSICSDNHIERPQMMLKFKDSHYEAMVDENLFIQKTKPEQPDSPHEIKKATETTNVQINKVKKNATNMADKNPAILTNKKVLENKGDVRENNAIHDQLRRASPTKTTKVNATPQTPYKTIRKLETPIKLNPDPQMVPEFNLKDLPPKVNIEKIKAILSDINLRTSVTPTPMVNTITISYDFSYRKDYWASFFANNTPPLNATKLVSKAEQEKLDEALAYRLQYEYSKK